MTCARARSPPSCAGTNINLVKRSDGTTTAADPDDIGGTVRLSFTGAHPLTGEVTIEAGRLIIDGTLSGGVLTVRGTYDLKGRDRNWTGVRLVSGRIIDSGREVADGSAHAHRIRRPDHQRDLQPGKRPGQRQTLRHGRGAEQERRHRQ